jgi:hypothetical protein
MCVRPNLERTFLHNREGGGLARVVEEMACWFAVLVLVVALGSAPRHRVRGCKVRIRALLYGAKTARVSISMSITLSGFPSYPAAAAVALERSLWAWRSRAPATESGLLFLSKVKFLAEAGELHSAQRLD